MDYFFQEHLRWSGWFTNPNHFAAWLALVAPWCWVLSQWSWSRTRVKWRWAGWVFGASCVADLAVLIALAGTYSRGGWVAWIVGALVWMVLVRAWRTKAEAVGMGLRVLVAAGAVVVVSAQARLDPSGWGQDRSVTNRLEVWTGAAQMMAARPWTGWGAGQSGWVYAEAYQPVEREEIYRTCVNSYLTLGAEHGLWVFMLLVGMAVAPLAWGWTQGREGNGEGLRVGAGWRAAAVASWTAWAVANGFSTLSEVRGLWPWVVPVALAAFIGLSWRRLLGAGAIGAVGAALLAGGVVLWRPSAVNVKSENGWWRFTAAGTRDELRTPWLVVPDDRVLGPVPGREVRRLALARPDLEIWMPQVPAPFVGFRRMDETRDPARALPAADGVDWAQVWVLGAASVPKGIAVSSIGRLHPLDWPGEDELRVGEVILPQAAGEGNALAWRRWAEVRGVAVRRSGLAGNDVRARWPEVVLESP